MIFWHAFTDLLPKAAGMGLFGLVIAVVSKRTNVKIAEAERERLFRGNRDA